MGVSCWVLTIYMARVLVFVLICLASQFYSGSSLNCTVCEDELNCGSYEGGIMGSGKSEECTKGWMCGKHICNIDGKSVTGRKCMDVGDLNGLDLEDQCTDQDITLGDVTYNCSVCICNSDNCNGGMLVQISMIGIVSGIILT